MTPASRTSGKAPRQPRSRARSTVLAAGDSWQLPLPPPVGGPSPVSGAVTVLTIGHSSLPADEFLALLRSHGASVVLDVRSSPYSRFVPHFNRESLQALLSTGALGYEWAGETLGGRPPDATCYHGGVAATGKLDYAAVRRRPWYQHGVHRTLEIALRQRVVLLCSEEDPRRCHRHHLVAQSLVELGVRVLHIRRTGEIEDAVTLQQAGDQPDNQQLRLGGFSA